MADDFRDLSPAGCAPEHLHKLSRYQLLEWARAAHKAEVRASANLASLQRQYEAREKAWRLSFSELDEARDVARELRRTLEAIKAEQATPKKQLVPQTPDGDYY